MTNNPLDSLLARLGAGDQAALEQFFRDHEPYLRMVARHYLSSFLRTQLDSMDLVQSAWLRVLRRLRITDWQFTDRQELRALLAKTIRNRLIDHARRMRASRQREKRSAAETHARQNVGPRPSENAQAGELWERMLALCPVQHQPILHLKRQGLPLKTIAARTGLHPGSVRRILYDLASRLARAATGAEKQRKEE
jgi:RNA polymerase sigma factor (sigma-70 family)